MDAAQRERLLRQAIAEIAERCPRLVRQCYWAGTSAIALEETGHRESFDLDFHSLEPLVDTRPFLAELELAFPEALEIVQAPDAHGSGFTGALRLTGDAKLTVQVFAGFEPVPETDVVASTAAPGLRRVTVRRYLLDKLQCVLERLEARDLIDIAAVLQRRPELTRVLRAGVAAQDLLLLAERLLGWTDESIGADLRAYPGTDPAVAIATRDQLLALVKQEARR
ncbi:MAG: nucleotidyl transferase AbiEii/AbiGii toxin family protein [Deltaproteobacteria bacterium]|nr:nucleotidyl transferase AbiEii/AbiGii toxin family protein [Deltaproteobacteria bacterium]